jgi:hypothetical protein
MSIRADIRAAIINAILTAPTDAGGAVFGPRAWPDSIARLPCVIVQSPPHERAVALIKGPPSYETRAIFPITVRVASQQIADTDAALESLIVQIKEAIFANLEFLSLIEQVASVETRTVITDEGQYQIGEAVMLLECEFPEFYQPAPGIPLAEIQATIPVGDNTVSFDLKL